MENLAKIEHSFYLRPLYTIMDTQRIKIYPGKLKFNLLRISPEFSIHCTSYLDNVSHLIKKATTTLSNSLLCNILLFGDNQFNDNKLILESTVDFVKKRQLGDRGVFLRCLMAIRNCGNFSFNFTICCCYLSLFLTLNACCCRVLEIL